MVGPGPKPPSGASGEPVLSYKALDAELQRLRREVERMRAILRSEVEGAMIVLDLDGTITSWNEAATALLGYTQAEMLGRSGDLLFTPEDRAADAFARETSRAAVLGQATAECWQVRRDGSRVWTSRTATTLRDASGQPCGFLNRLRDRSGQEQTRSNAPAAGPDAGATLPDGLAVFPEVLSRMFSTPMAAVSILEPDHQRFRVSVGLDPEKKTPIEQSFCAQAIKRPNEVLYVPDATRDPRFADNPLVTGDMGLRFYAGMPILAPSGTPIGALCVLDRVPRRVDDALLDQLRSLAEGVTTTLRLEATAGRARRRESEGKLTQAMLVSVFQNVDAAVIITRTSGAILLCNVQGHDLLRHSPEQLARLSLLDVIAPEHRAALDAADVNQLGRGASYRIESEVLRGDGTRLAVRITRSLVSRRDVPQFHVTTLRAAEGGERAVPPQIAGSVLGCIQFLGLEPVKAAYGPNWGKVRSKLLLSAENILKRRLSADDVYSRTETDGFNVWFKTGSEEENAARTDRIRREVQMMLLAELGEETTGSVAAYTQTAEIDDPRAPPAEIMQGLSRRMAERRREMELHARALVDQVTREQPRQSTPVLNRSGASIKASFVDLPRSLRGRFCGAMSLVAGPYADIETELLRLCLAADAVMDDFAEGQSRTHFITVPIALFMTRRGRDRFLAQWDSMPPRVGAQIFVMLSELPADLSHTRLQETVIVLKPITRGVGVLLDQVDTVPFQPQSSSLTMVGLCSRTVGPVRDAKLSGFILRMHQAKIPVLVQLTEPETAQRWHRLGADFTTAA